MWLCDSCGASLVIEKKIKPLNDIFGVNNIPFKVNEQCDKCQNIENLMLYPGELIKK